MYGAVLLYYRGYIGAGIMVTHLLLAQGSAKVTVASAPSNPSSQLRVIPDFYYLTQVCWTGHQ